jgi:ABC-type transport system involved in multi-copper enzyme maturation permease subunit
VSLKDINLRHLKLISIYSSRHAIRGGTGIVFAILALSCGLLIAHLMMQPMEILKQQSKEQFGHEMSDKEAMGRVLLIAKPVVAWAIREHGSSDANQSRAGSPADSVNKDRTAEKTDWPSYLLEKQPSLLSAIFLIMLFSTPFLVAFGAFNQFSGDVQSKGLRYQLFRTERTNIFFGRFLGTAVYTFIVMTSIIAIIALYIGLKVNLYEWSALISWSLRGILALCITCLPYVALCSLLSCMIDSPFGSLTMSSLIIACVPFFAVIARIKWASADKIKYILPWGVQNYLLHYSALTVFGTIAACLGYTVVFLLLGHLYFCRRDL